MTDSIYEVANDVFFPVHAPSNELDLAGKTVCIPFYDLIIKCPYCGHDKSSVITIFMQQGIQYSSYDLFECTGCSKSFLAFQALLLPHSRIDIQ